MKQIFNTLMVIVFFLCITLITLEIAGPKEAYSVTPFETVTKHHCDWEDCYHQGEVVDQNNFVSYLGYEEMTDGWCVEMTHFMNPEMTYEECDAYVMSGVE